MVAVDQAEKPGDDEAQKEGGNNEQEGEAIQAAASEIIALKINRVEDLPVVPTGDEQRDKEITALKKLLEQEKSHG
jgi:hypothetical protein